MLINHIIETIISLPRNIKKLIAIICDIICCIVATWLAFCLRFEQILEFTFPIAQAATASMFLGIIIFIKFGLYRSIFRYSGSSAHLLILVSSSLYAFIYMIIFTFIRVYGVPRSVGIIQPLLLFLSISFTRLAARYLLHPSDFKKLNRNNYSRILIYGTSSAAREISAALKYSQDITPIGFIGEDSKLSGNYINGLPVYNMHDVTINMKNQLGISEVLLVLADVNKYNRKKIIDHLELIPMRVRAIPSVTNIARGNFKIDDIKDIEISDILGREPILPNQKLLEENINGKVVLVTGAGGSIGSELARQITVNNPKTLILLELNEYALYRINQNLDALIKNTLDNKLSCNIIPVLGSVLDRLLLRKILNSNHVETIFHAAAYKHVPLVEQNPQAGISNNVFGTLTIVDEALRSNVKNFILISTDKAVRPTSVMGTTKRIAELILQSRSASNSINSYGNKLKFSIVRFGNVLGSSGSVVPLFRQQISNGGPVTVTHPEIIRFFMTIPEAAQLVIQAAAISEGGDVLLLDMGEPVKIIELARKMIHLSGKQELCDNNPDGEIIIKFTGLRPGEKLYEELLIDSESLKTIHPKILRAKESFIVWSRLSILLNQLDQAIRFGEKEEIYDILKRIVPEFRQ